MAELICQVKNILPVKENEPEPRQDPSKRYVYGLRGIRELFNVSHATAQRWKNTWLQPAIIQRGRKIMVDVEKALSLFDQYK